MDAPKGSYSITLMASVLGVMRAGYDAWKSRATPAGPARIGASAFG